MARGAKIQNDTLFTRWMKMHGLSGAEISRSTGAGLRSVYRWMAGEEPCPMYRRLLRIRWADFPY